MKKTNTGVVLITTMLLLTIIIMITSLLICSSRNTMILGGDLANREKAHYAADSGLAYVQYCLSKCPTWMAGNTVVETLYDPNSGGTIFKGFTVEKVPGGPPDNRINLVHGILNSGECEFYIAFWDGVGTFDATSGATSDKRKDWNAKRTGLNQYLPFYSLNALTSAPASPNNYSWMANGTKYKKVKLGTAHIIVEGRCRQTKRYVEAILANEPGAGGIAGTLASNNIDVDLVDTSSTFLVNSSTTTSSSLRSMGQITVDTGATTDHNALQIANGGTSYTGNNNGKKTVINGTAVDTATEMTDYNIQTNWTTNQQSLFNSAKLKYNSAAANPYWNGTSFTASTKATIKAGSWIYRNTEADPDTYNLFYYNTVMNDANRDGFTTTFAAEETPMVAYAGPTVLRPGGTGEIEIKDTVTAAQLDSGVNPITIKDAVGVEIYGGNSGFAVAIMSYNPDVPGEYDLSSLYRPTVRIEGTADPTLVTPYGTAVGDGGNIYVQGEISGRGKVISGGSLTFQGKSMLESDQNSGISLYARGDVDVQPVTAASSATVGDPNPALADFWQKYATTNGAVFSADYYRLPSTSTLSQVRDGMLEGTSLSSSASYVMPDASTKTYAAGTSLLTILTDTTGYNYDKVTAQELVSLMLSKNTAIGADTATGTSTTYSHSWSNNANWSGTTAVINGKTYSIYTKQGGTHGHYHLAIGRGDEWNEYKVSENGSVDEDDDDMTDEYGVSVTVTPTGYVSNDFATGTTTINIGGTFPITLSHTTSNYTFSWGAGGTTTGDDYIKMVSTASTLFEGLMFNDTLIRGLIYSWEGNVRVPDNQGGSFSIRGAIVSYGAKEDGSNDNAGTGTGGMITIKNARAATFTYDPDFLFSLMGNTGINTFRLVTTYF